HDVDAGIGDEVFHRPRLKAVLLGERARERAVEVRAGDDVEAVERGGALDVVERDDAASDDADAGDIGRAHGRDPTILRTQASARAAASHESPSISSCSTMTHSAPAASAAGRIRS